MVRYKVVKQIFGVPSSCYADSVYRLAYLKGAIVTAKEGTMGIAVFEKRHQAEEFLMARGLSNHNQYRRIIRVLSIGRGKRYRYVCMGQDKWNLDLFYSKHTNNLNVLFKNFTGEFILRSPPGTIFYQQVKVLE